MIKKRREEHTFIGKKEEQLLHTSTKFPFLKFFFFKNIKYFNIHIHEKRWKYLKKTDNTINFYRALGDIAPISTKPTQTMW